jgi:hypothetical protein
MTNANRFEELAKINVNEHVEKKAGLSYLSWAWAVDQLMRKDPHANWEFHNPIMFGETMMVSCTVTAFGKPMMMHLPVMDHKNQAIKNPDAFQVNKNMMRCLVKCIAVHGLGLYIYAGEDLPESEDQGGLNVDSMIASINSCADMASLKTAFQKAFQTVTQAKDKNAQAVITKAKDVRKAELEKASTADFVADMNAAEGGK